MLDRLKNLFGNRPSENSGQPAGAGRPELAVAALLIEAAWLDEHFSQEEQDAIYEILIRQFELGEDEAKKLFEEAKAAQHGSVEIYNFTRTLNDTYSESERIGLIELVWEVVYADGVLHDFEASLMRRLSGLLHVSDHDRAAARQRVMDRLNG